MEDVVCYALIVLFGFVAICGSVTVALATVMYVERK